MLAAALCKARLHHLSHFMSRDVPKRQAEHLTLSMNSDRPTFVMAAASPRQIGFLIRFGGTLARSIGRALALGKPRDGRGSVMGGEAKELPPCYGTSVAPAARLTDPGLTRADTGAGRVCISTTRRLPAVGGHATIPAGAVWQPLCTSAAPVIGWPEAGGKVCIMQEAWEAASCMPICIEYSIYCNCNGWLPCHDWDQHSFGCCHSRKRRLTA